MYSIKCQEINVSHLIIFGQNMFPGSIFFSITDFKNQGRHILWAFDIQPGPKGMLLLVEKKT
jgi:hypothetical protein